MPFIEEGLSLLARMGGPAALDAVVDTLYERLLGDERLQPLIKQVDPRLLYTKQVEAVSHVLVGTGAYTGRSFFEDHKDLIQEHGLNTTHFDIVAGHLAAALEAAGVPDSLVSEAMARIEPMRDVFRDGYVPESLQQESADALCRQLEEDAVALAEGCPPQRLSRTSDPSAAATDGGCLARTWSRMPLDPPAGYGGCCPSRKASRSSLDLPAGSCGSCPALDPHPAPGLSEQVAAVARAETCKPPSLQERLGGNDALKAVVDLFYHKVLQDGELASFFKGVSMAWLKMKQVKYLCYVFGAPGHCTGVDLVKAHAHLIREQGLTLRHFDRLACHFESTLQDLTIPAALVQEATGVLRATRGLFEPALYVPLERSSSFPQRSSSLPQRR